MVLVDGPQLASMIIECVAGVSALRTIKLARLDSDGGGGLRGEIHGTSWLLR